MTFTTWVRAQDAFGQFDVRKGDDLREGVSLVKDYPEHVGFNGRPGKPMKSKGKTKTSDAKSSGTGETKSTDVGAAGTESE